MTSIIKITLLLVVHKSVTSGRVDEPDFGEALVTVTSEHHSVELDVEWTPIT